MDPSIAVDEDTWGENVFSRSETQRREQDDEESLKWAALQKLPTYHRLRTAMMENVGADGKPLHEERDVRHLSYEDRQQIITKLLRITDEDNERFLLKFRERIDRWGGPSSLFSMLYVILNLKYRPKFFRSLNHCFPFSRTL